MSFSHPKEFNNLLIAGIDKSDAIVPGLTILLRAIPVDAITLPASFSSEKLREKDFLQYLVVHRLIIQPFLHD